MTVHKSQGSEFDRVLMVLPPEDTLLLTRELIYTGITRARQAVTLWSDEAVFSSAVKRRTERRSGLRERLVNEHLSNRDS
nr:ATP-binding domain-containing protein [Chlorobium limicola]